MKTYKQERDEAALADAIEDNQNRGYVPGHSGEVKEAFARGADWSHDRDAIVIAEKNALLQGRLKSHDAIISKLETALLNIDCLGVTGQASEALTELAEWKKQNE